MYKYKCIFQGFMIALLLPGLAWSAGGGSTGTVAPLGNTSVIPEPAAAPASTSSSSTSSPGIYSNPSSTGLTGPQSATPPTGSNTTSNNTSTGSGTSNASTSSAYNPSGIVTTTQLSPFASVPTVLPAPDSVPGVGPASAPLTNQTPDNVLGPVTLKATLEKTKTLPLTLKQALELASGHDIAIDIAHENTLLQKQNYQLSLAGLLPSISLTLAQSKFIGTTQGFGGEAISVVRNTVQPEITANYTLYTGGSNIFAIKANKFNYKAQKDAENYTRQSTLAQVSMAYYALEQAYWQRAIEADAVKYAQAELALNQARLKAGIGVQLDVLQSQTNLSNQQQSFIQAENSIAQNSTLLAELLNIDFKVDIVPATLDSTITQLLPYDTPAPTLLSIAKAHNPQIKEYEDLVVAGKYNVKTAIANFFPQINLTAYKDRTGTNYNNLEPGRYAGFQAQWNILQDMGFANKLGLDMANTNKKIADLNLQQADRTLEQTLANAVINLKTYQDEIPIARDALAYAQGEYQQAYGRVKGGVGTNIDLETAQSALTQARLNLVNAFLSYNSQEATILEALGLANIDTLTTGYQINPATATMPKAK